MFYLISSLHISVSLSLSLSPIPPSVSLSLSVSLSFPLRFIFWSASGKADKLERISTNGKHTKRISKNDLKVIRNLAVDVIDKRVFWLDIGKRRIESANYLGKKRNTIMEKIR